MIYTIIGAFVGMYGALCLGKIIGLEDRGGFSDLKIFMTFGFIFGGGGGFVLGSSALIQGVHPFNKMLNMVR